jgi:hypothetical protein
MNESWMKNNNNHSGITIVDDYILEKPHIKQNYMRSGVPFNCWPQKHFTHSTNGQQWFFYKNVKNTFKWMPTDFLPRSIRRPLNAMTNGLVVVDIKNSWVEMDVIHSNGFEWNCGSGIGHNML